MSFFDKWETALGNKNLESMMELMHPEWTMIMHSTGKIMNREEYKQTIGQVILSGKLVRNDVRCIYENDDVMVEHAMVTFPSGSTDAVLVVMILKDEKVFRTGDRFHAAQTISVPVDATNITKVASIISFLNFHSGL